MSRRRDDSAIDVLSTFPWWMIVILSGGVYVTPTDFLPPIADYGFLAGLGGNVQPIAGLLSALLLLLALFSQIKSVQRRRLLDHQSSLESIRAMSWRKFEILCVEAFRRQAYSVQKIDLGGPDGGVDLILRKHGRTTIVQCKRWKTFKIGAREVQELYGILTAEHADRAMFVTSGSYTAEARAFARGKPIDLLDDHALFDLVRMVLKHPPAHRTRCHNPLSGLPAPARLSDNKAVDLS